MFKSKTHPKTALMLFKLSKNVEQNRKFYYNTIIPIKGVKRLLSLTHVKMWTPNGWKPISADEAAKLHPDGGVAVHSGLFMCGACGQYVSFVHCNRIYFMHYSKEADKSCPDRVLSSSHQVQNHISKHDLPLRLKLSESGNFEFELGLLSVPFTILSSLKDSTITICSINPNARSYCYSLKERLQEDSINYIPIGQIPFSDYRIVLSCKEHPFFQCWPEKVQGIDPAGTLFDASGPMGVGQKKLPYDADVQPGKSYYLLKQGPLSEIPASIQIECISRRPIAGRYWYLYRMSGCKFDESSARFFLNFHCRLTEHPVSIKPIWPIYIENPYIIYHESPKMVFYVHGDVHVSCFPFSASKRIYSTERGQVFRVQCNDRQQLISAGHTKVLKYTYLWKDGLDRLAQKPTVVVTDINGLPIQQGIADKLPPKKLLHIRTPYDGIIIIERDGQTIEKLPLRADAISEIGPIHFGDKVFLLQGLDTVWTTYYERSNTQFAKGEDAILRRLQSGTGQLVPIPHLLGSTVTQLQSYPKIKQWLYKRIREGTMPVSSYRMFQLFYANLIGTREEKI